MALSRLTRVILTIAAGLLTAIPLLFADMSFVALVSLIPYFFVLFWDIKAGQKKLAPAYRTGLLFYMAFYLVIYHWFIYLYPLDFAGFSKGSALCVVLAGWLGLSLFQAAVFALLPVLFVLLCRTRWLRTRRFLPPLALAALWILFEWLQSLTWAGVPWARLSVGQYASLPMIQSAALFGSYFISFIIVLINGLIASAMLEKTGRKRLLAAAAVLLAANLGYGTAVLTWHDFESGEPLSVAALQGNISSHEKWTETSRAKTLNTYERLTRQAAEAGATLIVWPETALPFSLISDTRTSERIQNLAQELGVDLIVGTFINDRDAAGKSISHNALLSVGKDGSILPDAYKKRHLVPFGEYVPMEAVFRLLIPPLTELDMYSDALAPGEGSMLMDAGGTKIGALICFDSIYDVLTRESVRDGAKLLVLATNDSWFYDSPAVYQHNGHAVMRAVESGRYLVRAANTGISSIIAPNGEITEQLPPLVEGAITGEVYLRDEPTLYMRTGNLLIWLAAAGLAVLACSPAFERLGAHRHRKST